MHSLGEAKRFACDIYLFYEIGLEIFANGYINSTFKLQKEVRNARSGGVMELAVTNFILTLHL